MRQDESTTDAIKKVGYQDTNHLLAALRQFEPAIAWIFVGLVGWWGSGGTGRLILSQGDPGPWLVPRVSSTILLVVGTILLIEQMCQQGRRKPRMVHQDHGPSTVSALVTWRRLLSAGSVAVYVCAIPLLGFTWASAVFIPVYLRVMSTKWRWWSLLLTTALLIGYTRVLFDLILNVPLPAGGWLE